MEPWNLGSRLHIFGSMVPWFHLKIQCQKSKILLGGTMEPWNQGSRLHKKVPWNHGTQMCIMSNVYLLDHTSAVIESDFHYKHCCNDEEGD